jgi:hypothetical protein
LVIAVSVTVGWLGGSASPSDEPLGLAEDGAAGVLGTVETPCAAASLAAVDSRTENYYIIINCLHVFHRLMSTYSWC